MTPTIVAEPIRSTGPSVEALVRAGINGRSPPAVLPAGELVVQVHWRGIGYSASGGLSGTAVTPLGSGSVSSMAGWASLGAATAVEIVQRVRFEAALGARLFIARVSAKGFDSNTASTLLSPAAYAEAGFAFELAGPVILGLWGLASVRPLDEVLTVDV